MHRSILMVILWSNTEFNSNHAIYFVRFQVKEPRIDINIWVLVFDFVAH